MELNLDAGESPAALEDGSEARLYALVDRVNIACGGHAGDESTMRKALTLALQAGVRIGAHPSYPDRDNFGRVAMKVATEEVSRFVAEQVGTLHQLARENGITLDHVKPHGALYNALVNDKPLARAVAEGVAKIDVRLALVGLAGAPALGWWRELGFRVLAEGFADRRYRANGTLTPRTQTGAVLHDTAEVVKQVARLARESQVIADDGQVVPMRCDTLCTHADTPDAEKLLRAICALL